MRKHDEGYALPFVLVVMVVVCLVATAILSNSLRNIQSQSASIERMQDKYQAQGEIEKVIAVLENGGSVELENVELVPTSGGEEQKLTITVVRNTVMVKCELVLNDLTVEKTDTGCTVTPGTSPSYTYKSYEITSIETGGEQQ